MKLVYKRIGETPLECLRRHTKEKACYIGRLDPMAEGVMVLLEGEECRQRDRYLTATKKYTYRALLGVETDSLDVLGKCITSAPVAPKGIQKTVESIIGERVMRAPLYSAQTVEGKKLFWYAHNKQTVDLPLLTHTIFTHHYRGEKKRTGESIAGEVIENIAKVNGQFRQKEILEGWREFQDIHKDTEFVVYEAEIHVSSGTYIRSIIRETAGILGTTAIALKIQRTECRW